MTQAIVHVALVVRDYDEAIAFYTGPMGWDLLEDTRVEVAVRGGTATARIPKGTRPGQRLRLRGQGLHTPDGTRGDLLLVVRLGLPEELTDEQRELLKKLGESSAPVRGGAAS